MGEIDLVLIKLKLHGESEGVVVSCESHILLFVVVLEVGDVCAHSMPTTIMFLFGSRREGKYPHSIII